MVGCIVLLNTHFINVSFRVLIGLLQNPTRRLPKMSHVCRQGCLQDVSAQRCRAVQEAWEKTTLAEHKSFFIRENAFMEQRGPSRSTPGGISISFQVKCCRFIVTSKISLPWGLPLCEIVAPCSCRELKIWSGRVIPQWDLGHSNMICSAPLGPQLFLSCGMFWFVWFYTHCPWDVSCTSNLTLGEGAILLIYNFKIVGKLDDFLLL